MFNKIVTSLDSSDLRTVGIVVLTAFLFQLFGLAASFLIGLATPVPKYWLGSLVCACVFSNTTDLPVAYITTLSSGKPFSPEDGSKGIAYNMIFVAVFIFTMFNCGSFRLIQLDATRKRRDMDAGTFDAYIDYQPGAVALFRQVKRYYQSRKAKPADEETQSSSVEEELSDTSRAVEDATGAEKSQLRHRATEARHTSAEFSETATEFSSVADTSHHLHHMHDLKSITSIRETLDTEVVRQIERQATGAHDSDDLSSVYSGTIRQGRRARVAHWYRARRKRFDAYVDTHTWAYICWQLLHNFLRPPSATLIVSLIITMIAPLRALFYNANGTLVVDGIPSAPDGLAVLSFVMDFTSFVGAAQVPFGMMLLGASISRLRVGKLPRGFWQVVLGVALFKLVVLPVAAVLWAERLRHIGWLDPVANRMTILTIIITAGSPIATLHVLFLAMFAQPTVVREEDPETGEVVETLWFQEMDCLAVNVIFQYMVLFVSMGILLTYTLKRVIVV